MSSAAQSLSIAMLVAASVLAILGGLAVRHHDRPGARGFSLVMISQAAWTIVLAINIWPTQFLPGYVSMTFRNGFILLTVLGWAWLAVEYVRRERLRLRPLPVALLLFIPAITVLLTATNPLHYLAIGAETPTDIGGGPEIDWGPWHLVFMAYVFTISIVPAGLLLRDLRAAHGAHRRQILLLLGGFLVGFLGANDYLLTGAIEGIPTYLRLSPFMFLVGAGIWSVALFRHQLFGLVPGSRSAVIETIPDPVVAVDRQGRIVDQNPAAIDRLGLPETVVGEELEALDAVAPTVVERFRELEATPRHNESQSDTDDEETPFEVSIKDGDETRWFSVRIEPIGDGHEGSIIVFRDVTVSKRYERELETQRDNLQILNEVVRHDIRNDLMVVQGYADQLASHVDDEGREHLETVQQSANHAVEFTKTARELSEVMLQREIEGDGRMPLAPILERQVEEIRSAYPEAEITIDGDLPAVRVVADEMLVTVFWNPLQNAIEHNDAETPEVLVSVEERDETVAVRIADNGPGIPDDRKESVFGKGEKGLESPGTGLGLYLVRSLVERYGGDVWFEDRDDTPTKDEPASGAVFVIELPIADKQSAQG